MSDLGDGEGQEPGAGPATGTPPEAAEVERLQKENREYREQLRTEGAKRLAAEHGLSPTEAELLGMVPRDQQEAKAAALAEERKAAGITAPAPSGEPAPTEPENADAITAMQDGGEPPPTTPPEKVGAESDLLKRLDGVSSLADVQRIQAEERARLLGEG